MRTLAIAILGLIVTACSTVPKQVETYVKEFDLAAAEAHVDVPKTNLRIHFQDDVSQNTRPDAIATCTLEQYGIMRIRIQQAYWDASTDSCKRAILYHELAHCKLGAGHTETGLMTPNLNCAQPEKNLVDLLKQLR